MMSVDVPIQNILIGITGNVEEPGIPFGNDLSCAKNKEGAKPGENAEIHENVMSMNICCEDRRNKKDAHTLPNCGSSLI
jgi:hypothetical protein